MLHLSRHFTLVLLLLRVLFVLTAVSLVVRAETEKRQLPNWRPGYLDIHHISTGCGNSTFMVMPDGTTLLLDAGDVDRAAMAKHAPLKVQEKKPNGSRRAGEWIADYVRQFSPPDNQGRLDYVIISHFHSDHFGKVSGASPKSGKGPYLLGGVTDVAEQVEIGLLLDRAAPDYRIPFDLLADDLKGLGTLSNYVRFVKSRIASGGKVERFIPGVADQLVQLRTANVRQDFQVRNIAANGVLWSGVGSAVRKVIPVDTLKVSEFDENPFSIAILGCYGRFRYFAGADLTGSASIGKPAWFDMETPLAGILGRVDVMALNHHGNRDASNELFLTALDPRVVVEQTWISDQPGGEVVHRLSELNRRKGAVDVFATGVFEETRIAIGPSLDRLFKRPQGHIIIRVQEGGARYMVYILNDQTTEREVLAQYGPYETSLK